MSSSLCYSLHCCGFQGYINYLFLFLNSRIWRHWHSNLEIGRMRFSRLLHALLFFVQGRQIVGKSRLGDGYRTLYFIVHFISKRHYVTRSNWRNSVLFGYVHNSQIHGHSSIFFVHMYLFFFTVPDWNSLTKPEVWTDAAVQIFYSCGAGFGVHLAYASYNKFENDCYRDCLVTSAVNSFTSFFSGFVIFSYLGYMSHYQNKPIGEVADQGPGLVFEVYPEAIATLPGSQIWSCLFFITMIMLGMDSAVRIF